MGDERAPCDSRTGGFTYVELALGIALVGLLSTAVFQVFRMLTQSFTAQERSVMTQANVQLALNALTRNVRRAAFDIPDSITTDSLFVFADDTLGIHYDDPGIGKLTRTFYVDLTDSLNPKFVMVEQAGTPVTTTTVTIAEEIQRITFRYMMSGDTTLIDPPVPKHNSVRGIWCRVVGRSRLQRPGGIGGYFYMESEMLAPTPNIGG